MMMNKTSDFSNSAKLLLWDIFGDDCNQITIADPIV